MYIERTNLQIELIRYRKNVDFVHIYFCEAVFNAISLTNLAPNSSSAMLAYSLDGSRCSCHAYQNVSNTDQFGHCRF